MCQTWTILSQAIIKHKAQFQNNTDGSPSHPPRSATFSYHCYLAMILGCPSLKFLPITCNLLLHNFEGNEMWVRSAPLRHRVRHRFREAPHESGLSLKVLTKRSEWACRMMQTGKKMKKGLRGQKLGTWGHFCHCLDVPVWISWPWYEPQIDWWWDVMFQHVGTRSDSFKAC